MGHNNLKNKPARLDHLDVFKGISILFIIITHYAWESSERLFLLFPFWIDMAVPIFMLITGYVSSISLESNGRGLKESYKPRVIVAKWMRFIIPFILPWVLSVFARVIDNRMKVSIAGLFLDFFKGGTGPGSYYFPVMLQVVAFMPVIYYVINNSPEKGVFLCFLLNVLFEIIKTFLNMSAEVYRLCAFRYIFIIAFGCYLYLTHSKISKKDVLVGGIGFIYIICVNYLGINPIITSQWKTTSVFAVLFLVPLSKLFINRYHPHNNLLALLGRASFDIFVVQMIYYLVAGRLFYPRISSLVIRLVFNIIVCSVMGIVYYKIENPITQKIIKAIKSQ